MKIENVKPCYRWMRTDAPHIINSEDVQRILSIKDEESFGHGIFVYKDRHYGYFRPQSQHRSPLAKQPNPPVLEAVIQDVGIRLALCEAAISKWPVDSIHTISAKKERITVFRESCVWQDILFSFEKISRSRRVDGFQKFKMIIYAWSMGGELIAIIKAMGAAKIVK